MAEQFENIKLQTPNDYHFFAYVLGQRLRNPNFTPQRRQIFFKTLLQQIKPVCSFRCYQKIQKTLNEIANQKNLDQKEEREKQKKQANKKQKGLVDVRQTGRLDKHGLQQQQYSDDQSDYDDQFQEM